MLGKYFIFSIRRPAAPAAFVAGVMMAQLFIAMGFLVSPSSGIPVALPHETEVSSSTTGKPESSTVKILVPPPQSDDTDEDDDAVIIEAGNGTVSPIPKEPFHPMDCFMDKEKGPCRAIIDMWYFNQATKTCEQFQYSGCGGNGNRFSEKSECHAYCGRGGKNTEGNSEDKETSDDDDTIVIEAASSGEDNGNGTCPNFDGCGPLKCAVITDEKTGCKKCACAQHAGEGPVGSVSGTPSEDDDVKMKKEKPEAICGLAEVRGSCRAMLTRYRYDSKLKKCIMFHFGGCDSNGNNFVSEDKCNEFCKGQ